jgi:hypothetical protein
VMTRGDTAKARIGAGLPPASPWPYPRRSPVPARMRRRGSAAGGPAPDPRCGRA